MNFENKIIKPNKKISFDFFDDNFKYKLFKTINPIIEEYQIREEDFSDIYSNDKINKDTSAAKSILKEQNNKRTFTEHYQKEIASYFEGVIADMINKGYWLGANWKVELVALSDDIRNSIDLICTFKKPEQEQEKFICFDVTFAKEKDILVYKFTQIKNVIDLAYFINLKYFKKDNINKEELPFPKVIIGQDGVNVHKLLSIFGGEDELKNEKLQNDPAQFRIILECLYQLKYFSDYIEKAVEKTKDKKVKKRLELISSSYKEMYNVFHDIYESKKDLIEKHMKEIADDVVYQTIAEYTGNKESK